MTRGLLLVQQATMAGETFAVFPGRVRDSQMLFALVFEGENKTTRNKTPACPNDSVSLQGYWRWMCEKRSTRFSVVQRPKAWTYLAFTYTFARSHKTRHTHFSNKGGRQQLQTPLREHSRRLGQSTLCPHTHACLRLLPRRLWNMILVVGGLFQKKWSFRSGSGSHVLPPQHLWGPPISAQRQGFS